ncbi:PKD domain-containing protein [Candidatus Nitrosocosmicus sp. FF01]|uniref:PKD domain-containing protein n=1 Tax=Candidatus Nitrosocosmicus sp. FF01 TaxID=3397670 RepID=UPI0039E789AA
MNLPFIGLTNTVFAVEDVIDTINVGERPYAIAYNPDNKNIYVANIDDNSVSVIRSSDNEVIDTINVGDDPTGIAYNPDNKNIYVSNTGSYSVSVIRSSDNEVIDTISLNDNPFEIAYNPDNNNMYVLVVDPRYNAFSVIRSSDNEVIDTKSVGGFPRGIAYNPDNKNMYVATSADNAIYIISSDNEVIDKVFLRNSPTAIAYNPDNKNMYISNFGSNTISVISSDNEVIDTINVGDTPRGIAYNPDNKNIYVAVDRDNTVSVIRSSDNEVIDTINVGDTPRGIAYNPDNAHIYVVNLLGNTVSVIGELPPPTADAGPDQTVESGDTVQLDGSGSSDPRNETLTYQWTQTGGPQVTLSDSTSVNPTFTAPQHSSQIDYTFELVVTNENGIKSDPNMVTISVFPASPPTADAGPDQTVESGDTVQLDGSGSSDPRNETLTYQWTQTGGPGVMLDDSSSATPSFTTPDTNNQEQLVFELVVMDEQGIASEPDSVVITVNPENEPPPFSGIFGSGNNINIQVQENSGNNVGGQSGDDNMYSDSPILQDQSTEQNSSVVS